MLRKLPNQGYLLTDNIGLPRYWAAAWTMLIGASLADSTLKRHLSNIEALYLHVDGDRYDGALDDTLGSVDFVQLEEMLESFFLTLTNTPIVPSTAEQRWQDSLSFVREVCERIARTPQLSQTFEGLRLRLERLNRMYGSLRTKRKRKQSVIRALPAAVLEAVNDTIIPGSAKNPFKSPQAQWRAYVTFLLLLHQGLRRGEALSLPANFLKSEPTKQGRQFWLNVRTSEYEDFDPRHSIPSIKTISSIRQIPVSKNTADALLTYVENYRGRQNHSFFLSSAGNKPLSAEGVHYFFKQLTAALPQECIKILEDLGARQT